MMQTLKSLFIRGLLALIPLVATIYVLEFIFTFLDRLLDVFIRGLFGIEIPGIGALASLLLILFIGFIVTNVLGSQLIHYAERLLKKVPLVPRIYFAIKQIIQAFSMQDNKAFSKVVMVEYPRKGIYSVGFLLSECKAEIRNAVDKNLTHVFIPTTPNPTTGFLLLVPDDEIIVLDMTIEDGLKYVLSAGMV